jgi:hypothetical protein
MKHYIFQVEKLRKLLHLLLNASVKIHATNISLKQRKPLQPQLKWAVIKPGKYSASRCDLILEVLM